MSAERDVESSPVRYYRDVLISRLGPNEYFAFADTFRHQVWSEYSGKEIENDVKRSLPRKLGMERPLSRQSRGMRRYRPRDRSCRRGEGAWLRLDRSLPATAQLKRKALCTDLKHNTVENVRRHYSQLLLHDSQPSAVQERLDAELGARAQSVTQGKDPSPPSPSPVMSDSKVPECVPAASSQLPFFCQVTGAGKKGSFGLHLLLPYEMNSFTRIGELALDNGANERGRGREGVSDNFGAEDQAKTKQRGGGG
ncbi:hypothetical protein BKA70DRAFT_1222310 [Coprinopsis sp. MPI-PUGE-AT-0042]|nr:hypothetical protein BKA70DRAFT_1222310 [Coprinopsis sp. MPI-PUGE-AT-0042]